MTTVRRSATSSTRDGQPAWHVVPVVERVTGRTGKERYLLIFHCAFCPQQHLASAASLAADVVVRKAACGHGRIALHLPLEAVA